MKKQSGFTLIELIMVIVILGVLASFALPKFADLSDKAKDSVMEGVSGSVRSASALVHAQWLAEGGSTSVTTVTMEDGSVVTLTATGYINETDIGDAIDLDGDLTLNASGTAASGAVISFNNQSGDPCVVYDSGTNPPTITLGTYTDVDGDSPGTLTDDTCA